MFIAKVIHLRVPSNILHFHVAATSLAFLEGMIAKGRRLLALTIADMTNGPPPSRYQDLSDLESWGWATFTLDSTGPNSAADLIRVLSHNARSFPPNVLTAGKLTLHEDAVTINGKAYPATMGQFQSMLYIETGIFLAECNTTPMAMMNPRRDLGPATLVTGLPKLRYWSDIAFLQCKSLAPPPPPPPQQASLLELKIVVRYKSLNADTRAVCSAILASLRKQRQKEAKPGILHDGWLPRWTEVTFLMDSEEAKTLRGTLNGSGVL